MTNNEKWEMHKRLQHGAEIVAVTDIDGVDGCHTLRIYKESADVIYYEEMLNGNILRITKI
jgi:hypothetical protein